MTLDESLWKIHTAPTIDVSEHLGDSPFTVQWLLQSLYTADEDFRRAYKASKVEKVSTVNVCEGVIASLSQVYEISIKFEGSDHIYTVMMKVPGMASMLALMEKSETSVALDETVMARAHNRECGFYRNYAPHLKEFPLVKVYVALEINGSPGVIVMDSLLKRATTFPRWQAATVTQLFNFAKHLSYMQAYFLCLPPDTWLGKYPDNGLPDILTSPSFYTQIDQLCDLKPGCFEEAYKVFRRCASSKKFFNYTMTDVYKDIGLPPVLVHGDVWAENLLWDKNPDGSYGNELAALIDWQLIHEGSIAFDIASFLVLCVDGEIRREYEYQVLKFLYDRTVQLVEERGKSVDFTYDQMKQAYRVNVVPRAVQLMMVPGYAFSEEGLPKEEAAVVRMRLEGFLPRIQYAVEDALKYYKDIPSEKIE